MKREENKHIPSLVEWLASFLGTNISAERVPYTLYPGPARTKHTMMKYGGKRKRYRRRGR